MHKFWRVFLSCFLLFTLLTSSASAIPTQLVPGGDAVGIAMQTDGVYVTAFSEASDSPAKQAGVRIGDRIAAFDGKPLSGVDELAQSMAQADGSPVRLTVERGGELLSISVQPEKSGERWRLGLLVKDSVAGIGTLTYYDPTDGSFGALGHAINDSTGTPLLLSDGALVPVEIVGVQRGERGKPGSLIGVYPDGNALGSLSSNLPQGVFGALAKQPDSEAAYPVASIEAVRRGPAVIRCTVDGGGVRAYEVEITAVRPDDPNDRNLQLRVTDPALLSMTGGIVQGISGAPILQDGRLVGAVTHVLVDHPERGYGIFIGNMLSAAEAQAVAGAA